MAGKFSKNTIREAFEAKLLPYYISRCSVVCCSTKRVSIRINEESIPLFLDNGAKYYDFADGNLSFTATEEGSKIVQVSKGVESLIQEEAIVRLAGGELIIYSPVDGYCPLYEPENGLCKVHKEKNRPDVCKNYPLFFDKEKGTILLREDCDFLKKEPLPPTFSEKINGYKLVRRHSFPTLSHKISTNKNKE